MRKFIQYPAFHSSKTQTGILIKQGAELQVCPGCLQAAGCLKNDIINGTSVANKEKIFNFTSRLILTLNY